MIEDQLRDRASLCRARIALERTNEPRVDAGNAELFERAAAEIEAQRLRSERLLARLGMFGGE